RGEKHKPVLAALAPTDMDLHAGTVDVLDLQGQDLAQTQSHAVGAQDEGLVTEFAGAVDEGFDLGAGQEIGQGSGAGRLDDGDPIPVAPEDMVVEELQAVAGDLDGGPRVALHQVMEVGFELLDGKSVGAPVPILGEPADGSGIDIDSAGGLALSAQRAKMLAVKGIELLLLRRVHVEFLQ